MCYVLCSAELKFFNCLLISFRILPLDVVQELAALAYHLEEATTAVIIFLVRLQMLRKMGNALRQDSDLHEGGTRIFRVLLVILHETFLFCPLHSSEEKFVKRVWTTYTGSILREDSYIARQSLYLLVWAKGCRMTALLTTRMTQKEIFRKAWSIARLSKYKKLLWFGFIPAFLSTVVLSLVYSMRGYQYWVELFEKKSFLDVGGGFLESFVSYLMSQPLLAILLFVVLSIFGGCYMLLPIFFHGGLIKLTEQAINGEHLRMRQGIIFSSQNFLQLFETSAITYPFRMSLVFIVYWAVRTFAPKFIPFVLFPLGCWLLVSVVITVLLLFTEYYIVLKGENIFQSYMSSMQTVFLNAEEVLHMVFLCLLIGLRILLNTGVAIGLPLLVMYIFSWFTSSLLVWLAWPVAIIIGLGSLIMLSYINAIFAVFLTAAWTLTFMQYTDTLPESLREKPPEAVPTPEEAAPQMDPGQIQIAL